MLNIYLYSIAFIFGSIVGSFLNVAIIRLPKGESILFPPSHCPGCGKPIKFYDNVPILSYILLRGKCRNCQAKISLQYPLVEFLAGTLSLAIFFKFPIFPFYIIYFVLIAALIVVSFIDLEHRIIPDLITLPGIPVGFAASFFLPEITYPDSLAGIFLGGGTLYLIALTYHILTKKEGMGGGDIKLLAMLGGFIGIKGVLFTIFFGSLLGTLVGVVMIFFGKKGRFYAIPFGPFLSTASVIYLFFGKSILTWYLGTLSI